MALVRRRFKLAIPCAKLALLGPLFCGVLLGAAPGCREPDPEADLGPGDTPDLAGPGPDLSTTPIDRGFVRGDPTRLLLRGRVVTPGDVLSPGEVLIKDGRITCVAQSCAQADGGPGATLLRTGGVIFPGLVDAHNHTQYNYLPPWQPVPARTFTNRGQWAARTDYKDHTASVNDNEVMYQCQQVKYGEVRALIGGTTTIQGTGNTGRACYRTLVHNAEYGRELGPDRMRTNIPGIAGVSATDATALTMAMDDGSLTAYVLHLAEGIDETSRREFDALKTRDLVRAQTVIIHGTALGPPEFTLMGQAGTKLVWSPLSNLNLYGKTTDVRAAMDAGVKVALAPDWTLSGSPSLLGELKVAARVSREQSWGLTPQKLTEMVTSTAADVLALSESVGRVRVGLLGDLLVIDDRGGDPYQALIDARLQDVALVVVQGRLRYGDPQLVGAVDGRCEALPVCGVARQVCVPDNTDGTDTLNEDFMTIRAAVASFYAMPYPLSVCN